MAEQNKHTPGYAIKVLNGALNGIEFFVGPHAYFICTDDSAAGDLAFADRTLQIPGAAPAQNLILEMEHVGPDDRFDVKICFPDRQETRQCTLNQICQLGGLTFAVRRDDEDWSKAVLAGAPAIEADAFRLQATDGPGPSSAYRTARRSAWQTGTIVALLLAGSLSVWYALQSPPTLLADPIMQLVGDRPGYSVHSGNDGNRYVFAPTVQQAEWVTQAVHRQRMTDVWWVVTPQAEETRVTYLLERNNVAFYAIRFNDPEVPTLLLSKNRNQISEEHLQQIRSMLLDAMPYARDVRIDLYDDTDVVNRAQQGLRALGFDYQTVRSDSGVTLSSWMPSTDVHLTEFSRYVTQFYQTWGRRYVHFSADISEDALKNKSYKYGDDGYVSLSRSHWMFNQRVQ